MCDRIYEARQSENYSVSNQRQLACVPFIGYVRGEWQNSWVMRDFHRGHTRVMMTTKL
jgi:hypothetical protein